MTRRPRILICNDDGIHAPGIRHLWQALHEIADCTVVAPSEQQSGKGLSITLHSPLRLLEVEWPKDTPAYRVTGTPADTIKIALKRVCEEPPDLIVAGINAGSNAGRNVLYSGTVGCIIEGVLRGIPGVAFSLIGNGHLGLRELNYSGAEATVRRITEYILAHPLREGSLLNVNMPSTIRGVRWARQGLQYWMDNLEVREDPNGDPYCWLGGELHDWDEHEDSDIAWLAKGYASVVPIHVSLLTDHEHLDERRDHFHDFVNQEVIQ